jgi:hypothetical protein
VNDTALDSALRTTSDGFIEQLERLLALEERKRETPVDDARFPALAREVEEAAAALLERAGRQADLAVQAHTAALAADVGGTIEPIPADLTPAAILGLWRDAERRLALAAPDTSQHAELSHRAATLCAAYQAAYRSRG